MSIIRTTTYLYKDKECPTCLLIRPTTKCIMLNNLDVQVYYFMTLHKYIGKVINVANELKCCVHNATFYFLELTLKLI